MSDWELQTRKNVGPYSPRGWYEYPCVRIGKTGLSFNRHFMDAFVGHRKGLLVYIDSKNRRLGFKVPGDQDATDDVRAFQDKKNRVPKTGGRPSATYMSFNRPAKLFPDAVKATFRAILNSGERIIEVDLSPDNRVK